MQIDNPFQMNDWEINKFLKVVLAVQFAMWGAIALDNLELQIPILRLFIGFIYLLFIPGILILRVLKLHKLGSIETLLYAIGLSIATLMATGFFLNMFLPRFEISEPISITPLIFTISLVVLSLCYMSYKLDNEFSDPSYILVKDLLSPPALFLCLIPFLSIFGTYLVNYHQNNILLLILIIVIVLLVLLIGFDKIILPKMYPFTVFIISISLLLHTSLISMYIWGWDIHVEYYLSNIVIENSQWDSTFAQNVNAMLSVVMLAPIFSAITSTNLTWVFKIVYPALFSLVPLGLYRVIQKQTNDKIAFLSVFFFMSLLTFYMEMIQMTRQQIAELFLVLLILLMIDKNMNQMKRSILLIIFATSMSVSHYGISYIFLASLVVVWFLLYFNAQYRSKSMVSPITSSIVLLYFTFTITWYMNISNSSALNSIVQIGNHIATSFTSDFLNKDAAQGLAIIQARTSSSLYAIAKYLHLISQFFIGVGVLSLLSNRCKMIFEKEYAAFSYVNFMILLAGIAIPFVASSLNTSRLYQISLMFLAPFFAIGGATFFSWVSSGGRSIQLEQYKNNGLKILSVFLAIFLLFNSGWIYEVTNDKPSSFSFSEKDYPIFNEREVISAEWLNNVKTGMIYADDFRWMLPACFEWEKTKIIPIDNVSMEKNSYLYLGSLNIKDDAILISHIKGVSRTREYVNSTDIVGDKNKIYTNSGSSVYQL